MRRLWAQLLQHWGRPVPALPDASELAASKLAATAANLASRVHQADLASRAMLNAALEHVHKVGPEARRNGCVCVGGWAANHAIRVHQASLSYHGPGYYGTIVAL
jgi:hypothetical protein